MATRKFRIGQFVSYRPRGKGLDARSGIYQVIALLPESDGEFRYRIKHPADAHQRIAGERELREP